MIANPDQEPVPGWQGSLSKGPQSGTDLEDEPPNRGRRVTAESDHSRPHEIAGHQADREIRGYTSHLVGSLSKDLIRRNALEQSYKFRMQSDAILTIRVDRDFSGVVFPEAE